MKLIAALISLLVLVPRVSEAQTTINAVYFGQTHVLKASDTYFGLVGNREALIKAHVINPAAPASPAVSATLSLGGQTLVVPLTGPATLPASIPDGPGVVQHSFANTFTGYIPAAWVKTGLRVTVTAGSVSTTITDMKVGAPSKVLMTMLDIHYFSQTTGNYPNGTFDEIEAKWPVADLEIRRRSNVVFPELVIPPRSGVPAARVKSRADYTAQTGLPFDGEQAAALEWNAALKRAAGRSGGWSLYYLNIYNANAGGQAGGFAGVGNGTSVGILHHELGHALSLPHWGDSAAYPYKGAMHGISAPSIYNATHAGPAWAFDLRNKAFIPCKTQSGNTGGNTVGTYKADPMQGGGTGWQEPAYLMNHFSDYSVNQMRSYLHSHMVVWNPALNSYARWNQAAGDYTTTLTNNGVQFPTTRDVQVISIMATMSGAKPDVTMVYPPIGPYTSGLIRLFDATVSADRSAANSLFNLSNNCDYSARVVQNGVTKTYIIPASSLTSADPLNANSIETEAINLPASAGTVTKIELLSTPNVEDVGLPTNPSVLYTWSAFAPEVAAFEIAPLAYSTSTISMRAVEGQLAPGFTGPVEYRFTETTGNPGASSSGWQASRTYTDSGLQAGTAYSYRVEMRAGSLTAAPSVVMSATTSNAPAKQSVVVNSTQQFNLQSGSGLKGVTGLGTFNASGADKLVVVISTEDANNAGTGFVYEVRYNGKVMTEAIQENAGGNTGTAAIFFLDNPESIGSGTIQVSAENPNGGIGCAYALSHTMAGFGISNRRTGSTANSVNITTIGDGSVVIAVIDNAGKPNNSGTPTVNTPLIQASTGSWGSQWGGHASGYQAVISPTTLTLAFTTSTGTDYSINIAAVEFPARPPSPNRWIQTAGGTRNWTESTNWDDGIVPSPASGTTMDFSTVNIGANTTLNLGADRAAQLWKFGDTSGTQRWIVSAGNTLTLAGTTPGFQVNNATTQIDSIIAGTAGLSKTGEGNLTLTGANSYTGATTINGGVLQIGNAGTTGSLAVSSSITNHSAIVFNRSNTITQGTDFATVIAGTGTLTKSGAGNLILSGSNTYTGTTTISAGTLQLGNGGTSGTLSPSSAIINHAALVFNRSNGVIQGVGFADAISGTGSLTNDGTGSLTLNSANTYSGLTTVNASALKVLHANALGTTAAGTVVNGSGSATASNARLDLEGGITITGEFLTLSGAGNFFGALSSTSGSNVWAGNVTIASAGTRLGATTGNTLTISGVIDSGALDTGLIIRTQDLASPVILSGANTYLGDTTVLVGKLQLSGGNNRLPIMTKLVLGSSGTNPDAEIDLNGRSQEVAGLALISTATPSKNSINNSSTTAAALTVNATSPSTFASTLKGNLALVKTGSDSLMLSGGMTYSGNTTVGAGTLVISAGNPSLAGGLIFGSANASSDLGNLNLTTSSATFAGSALVRTNNALANSILIGHSRTLTIDGGLTLGYDAAGGSGETHSGLTVAGAGAMVVNGDNINISVNQAAINQAYWSRGTLDVSDLAAFSTNVTNFHIGVGNQSQGPGDVLLSNVANTILATTLQVGNTGANNGRGTSKLILGTGTNRIQADTIYIGRNKGSGPGLVSFASQAAGSPGTVIIANRAGNGRSNLEIANQLSNGTAAGAIGTLDLRGHVASVTAGNVILAASSAAFSTGSPHGVLSFDAGTFDVNTLNMAIKSGASTGTANATLNVGGGTFTVNTSFTLGSHVNGGAAVATLNITGGTFVSHPDITKTGGTSTTATINLDGPVATTTLDMTGNAIGTSAQPITLNARQGTLRNLASINGSGGLTKNSAGTVILRGSNTYSGPTIIQAGTLALGENNALPGTAITLADATLDAATFTDAVGTLEVTGNASIHLGTGAALTFSDSSAIPWTGTLTISGTFVSGSSIRFGTSDSGLTAAQLSRIIKPGGGSLALDSSGFLVDAPVSAYSAWASTHAPNSTHGEDEDNDGVCNAVEYVLGGSVLRNDIALLPTMSHSGGNILFSFKRIQTSINPSTSVSIQVGTALHSWPGNYLVGEDTASSSAGVTVQKGQPIGFDTVTLSIPRSPDRQKFLRLNVTIAP